jgi:hypothetical protein
MYDERTQHAVAYRIDYVDVDGRALVTAVHTVDQARDLVAEIAARGGRILSKRVERGQEAAHLLCAVRQAEIAEPDEVF